MNNTVNPGAGRRGNPRENLFITRPTPSPSLFPEYASRACRNCRWAPGVVRDPGTEII